MATQVLASDFSALGTWQLDYDTVGLTVGHTCDTTAKPPNPTTRLVLTVIQVNTTTGQPTGLSFSKDVSGDFGKGRVVDFSGIPNSAVPVHVKGQIYPFDFSGIWTP